VFQSRLQSVEPATGRRRRGGPAGRIIGSGRTWTPSVAAPRCCGAGRLPRGVIRGT